MKRSTSFDCRPDLYKVYGSKVFREAVIRERLTKGVYDSFLKTIQLGLPLNESIAPDVAKAMMTWAIEQGATHYAHWFLPMTNFTACKHDSFFNPTSIGEAMLDFPASTLVKGEPDASSFPSGGLRATFEARGYTGWDPTSPAFIRDRTLFIPTCFLSYNGESLDQKVPLLRSTEAINNAGLRYLKFFPKITASRVLTCAGAEQEYFLIPRELYIKRLDLRLCGRTLLGYSAPKGQQLDDHYMARIRVKVGEYMADLEQQLWELGVPAKTKHNEVAPSQHELAPVYENVNLASDHNQMMMEQMRIVAKKKDMACLLHEKPFAGVNGSGKHNNYSLCTDTDVNLLQPHNSEEDDMLFVLTVCAFIRSIDIYSDLLRSTAASASNDQRLGGFEAPPPIVSIFLGDHILHQVVNATNDDHDVSTQKAKLNVVPAIPELKIDDSDRNRTSPMAFTGNKFEFRMLGSSQSIALVNTILNTIVADSLDVFATRLEKASDIVEEKKQIIIDTLEKHGRVVYNGNNYSKEWEQEAIKRGLPIIKDTVESNEAFIKPENVAVFEKFKVLTENECKARYEIRFDTYIKTISIEASTLIQMIEGQILPSIIKETGSIAHSYTNLLNAGIENSTIKATVKTMSDGIDSISSTLQALKDSLEASQSLSTMKETATFMRDKILPLMNELRASVDAIEPLMSSHWPIPTYADLLFSI